MKFIALFVFIGMNFFPKWKSLGMITALAIPCSVQAVELAELAGDWTLADFTTPSRLREIFYNTETETSRTGRNSSDFARANEILTDAFYPDPLSTEIRTFSLSAGGVVTGQETGQILSMSANWLIYSDSNETSNLYSSVTGDVLISSEREADVQSQTLCLKRPTTFANSDLAGTWALVSMFNPTDITTTADNGRLADVYFVGESGFTPGTITLNGSGGFTGTFAGSVSGTPNGNLTITTAEDGNIPAKINASKNIIAVARGDADESEYTLLVKKPDTLATADFEGTWRVSSIQIPTSLTENFYNIVTNQSRQADSSDVARENEMLVDIFHKSQPDLSRLQLMIDSSGNITGSERGTIVANGDRSATVTIDGTSFPIYPNADKTFMMAAIDDADTHEFVIAVKPRQTFPATFEEQVDLTPISINGKLILNWDSASNLMLEESSTLGGWGEVTEAAGSDSFTPDTSVGGSRFYRVAERPAEE